MHKQICTYFTASQILIKSTEPKESLKIRGGGGNSNVGGIICPTPSEIGLTDLSNSGALNDRLPKPLPKARVFQPLA